MAISDPVVTPLAYELLACLEQEIDKVAEPPLYRGRRPGQVVDHLASLSSDECCSGLAWVRVVGFVPSSFGFPAQDSDPSVGVTRAWAITLEMGVIRCAPTPDVNSIPTNEQWNAVSDAIDDDAAAMRRAICCFIDNDPTVRRKSVLPLEWQPISVEGGCTGGTLQIVVKGPACDCVDSGGS